MAIDLNVLKGPDLSYLWHLRRFWRLSTFALCLSRDSILRLIHMLTICWNELTDLWSKFGQSCPTTLGQINSFYSHK